MIPCGLLRPPVPPHPQPSPISPDPASLARPCRRRRTHAHRHRSGGEPDLLGPPEHAQRHLNLNLLLLGARVRLARPGTAWRVAVR
eukprot:1956407-Prymnesium_polylepis.1